jgi:hypothetical protein
MFVLAIGLAVFDIKKAAKGEITKVHTNALLRAVILSLILPCAIALTAGFLYRALAPAFRSVNVNIKGSEGMWFKIAKTFLK